MLSTIYIDSDVSFDKSEMVGHLTTLLGNEHSLENFALVSDLLAEYLTAN